MKKAVKRLGLIFIAMVFFLPWMGLSSTADYKQADHFIPQELLRMVSGSDEAKVLSEQYDLELLSLSEHGLAVFLADSENEYLAMLSNGFSRNGVSAVMAPPVSQVDPYLDEQYAISLMNVDDSWALSAGSASVMIAIIDTGIDSTHPEFSGRISELSYNTVTDQTGLSAVADDDGHGTMVAGVIGAIRNNRIGIAGIVQNCPLLVIKANNAGVGEFTDASVIEGIYYAVDHGADIINISLGGSYANPATHAAIQYAAEHEVFVVGASGNDGTSEAFYPAAFAEAISVSAVDSTPLIASYSNYGNTIDLSAPGSDIVTTARDNSYMIVSGTSFAAPQVAGVLGLLLSYRSELTYETIKEILFSTAIDVGTPGNDIYYGAGIVNAYAALTTGLSMVSFETNGGTAIASFMVVSNQPFTMSSLPEKAGWLFENWYRDPGFTALFTIGTDTIESDTTLYAKYTFLYHTVSFVTSGSAVASLQLDDGATFTLPVSTKTGFTFAGWYMDEALGTPYVEAPVTAPLVLYAKFEPIPYTVSYFVDSQLYSQNTLFYDEMPTPPILIREGYNFDGWFVDAELLTAYVSTPIAADLSLYAKFSRISLSVSFVTDGSVPQPIPVFYGDSFTLPTSTKIGYAFSGWYTDVNRTEPYVSTPVTSATVLYAGFTILHYTVNFYDFDQTLLKTTSIAYGSDAVPPADPSRASSVSFNYQFSGWQGSYMAVASNQDIIATYSQSFIPASASLLPGIDTIPAGSDWTDGGITLSDSSLTYLRSEVPDIHVPGTYSVIYSIQLENETVYSLERIITVTEGPTEFVLTLFPGISTLLIGEAYLESGAESSLGTVIISGSVDTTVAGIYPIVYTVEYENTIVQKTRYVFVIDPATSITVVMLPWKKDESGWIL